jgi:hypothetical protein
MSATIDQQFPTKQGAQVVHKRWALDVGAAARVAGITVERMTREATDMAAHFPRWLLVLVRDGQPVLCKCDGLYVFDRGVRCVLCDKSPKDLKLSRAGWFGVLPPIGLDGLARIKDQIVAKPPRRHVVGTRDALGTFMLVPLVVQYPGAYPRYPLDVYYLPEFRDIPGVPSDEYSHAFHMIGRGRMCLFAPNEWTGDMACREVLQQRAYPHVIKFLNYANGKKDAFAIVTR